jgi:hypothetical protein
LHCNNAQSWCKRVQGESSGPYLCFYVYNYVKFIFRTPFPVHCLKGFFFSRTRRRAVYRCIKQNKRGTNAPVQKRTPHTHLNKHKHEHTHTTHTKGRGSVGLACAVVCPSSPCLPQAHGLLSLLHPGLWHNRGTSPQAHAQGRLQVVPGG